MAFSNSVAANNANILICQSCAQVNRRQSIACSACGNAFSEHLADLQRPELGRSAAPAAPLHNKPRNLERTAPKAQAPGDFFAEAENLRSLFTLAKQAEAPVVPQVDPAASSAPVPHTSTSSFDGSSTEQDKPRKKSRSTKSTLKRNSLNTLDGATAENQYSKLSGKSFKNEARSSKSSTAPTVSAHSVTENLEDSRQSQFSRCLRIASIVLVSIGLLLVVLVANCGDVLAGGTAAAPSTGAGVPVVAPERASGLTGQWEFAYENSNGPVGHGTMTLNQSGESINGYGMDSSGKFQVNGSVNGQNITLNKRYIKVGQVQSKPIVYCGTVQFLNENVQRGQKWFAHISGVWQVTRREGMGWRAHVAKHRGSWEAGLCNRAVSTSGLSCDMPIVQPVKIEAVKDPKDAQNLFLELAVAIVGLGAVLAMVSLKFFGPSGLLSIWAKKEYIPSQFRSQHFKMVDEIGKPLQSGGLPLGERLDWGLHQFWRPKHLNMTAALRNENPHTLIVGSVGTGKSRLMASMITQDIECGDRAVVVIDSDGSLFDLMMNWIAAHPDGERLAKRVTVIDPGHTGQKICYNPIEFPADGDLQNAASALVCGFKASYTESAGSQTQWSEQTANILRNSALLLMANGKTLTDLPVLLADNDFRDVMLETVDRIKDQKSEYITLMDAWTNYKRLARTEQWINWIEPILNRVQPMLGDPKIRPILTNAKSDLSMHRLISEKRVLFVKTKNKLLGSLIVTGIKQAALSLSAKSEDSKHPCALYLDEFNSFMEKDTFDAITSETRKLQIGFCGSTKTLQTMPEEFRNRVIINVGMMAVFAIAKKDGDILGPQMFRVDGRKIKHNTIQSVFNKVNFMPQFELISDEEKLNIDRIVGQEEQTYFFYRVGTIAGVFHMKAQEFNDIPESDVNLDLIDQMLEHRLA